MVVEFLPLFVAILICGVVILGPKHGRVDRILTIVALRIFGKDAGTHGRYARRRAETLRSAHIGSPYRVYAARTYLFTSLLALAGSIMGVYAIAGMLQMLSISPDTLTDILPHQLWFLTNVLVEPDFSATELFWLFLVSSGSAGLLGGVVTYYLRWFVPIHLVTVRQRRIDASTLQVVAFIFALSRSGMAFPDILGVLAEKKDVYGDAAEEIHVAVNDMNVIGTDVITAVSAMGNRTPSEQFSEFAANLGSVLRSGQNVTEFLNDQYRRYREEAETQQEQFLNLLATLAEVYVAAFVAGPLFLITILVVIGITAGGTLTILQVTAYVILPLANLAFIIYLSTITEMFRPNRTHARFQTRLGGMVNVRRIADRSSHVAETDGGFDTVDPNAERLAISLKMQHLESKFARPVKSIIERPDRLLYVTVPVAIVVTLRRLPNAWLDGQFMIGVFDDIFIQAVLFVVGTYTIAHELHRRRIDRLETLIPDLLDRLASVNEAGTPVVECFDRVRRTDLGELNTELEQLWRDIEWGASIESALYRFERRVQTPTITRMVTLITNATTASGNLAPVLRIAADQAHADRRLERQRRQEMVSYLVVIYLSFFVFLVIIVVLNNVLLPSLPDQLVTDSDGIGGVSSALGYAGGIDENAYTLVFFHTAMIQGTLSGFIAGQMGGGTGRSGAKHAAILLTIAYLAFILIL